MEDGRAAERRRRKRSGPAFSVSIGIVLVFSFFASFGASIAVIYITGTNWTSACDAPLQTWILVYVVVLLFFAIFGLVYLCCFFRKSRTRVERQAQTFGDYFAKKSVSVFAHACSISILFTVAWIIVGSVWFFGSKTCESTSASVYHTAQYMLYYIYAAFGLGVLISLVSLCLRCVLGDGSTVCAGVLAERWKTLQTRRPSKQDAKEEEAQMLNGK